MSKPSLHTISHKEIKEYQEFLVFKVIKAAHDTANNSKIVVSSGSGDRHQNPTIGCTSESDSPNQALRGSSTHSTVPASSRKDYKTAVEFHRDNSTSCSCRRRNCRMNTPLSARKGVLKLPTSTPPALSKQDDTTLTLKNDSPTSPLSSTPPCHKKVIDWPSLRAHPVCQRQPTPMRPHYLRQQRGRGQQARAKDKQITQEEDRRDVADLQSAKTRPSAPNRDGGNNAIQTFTTNIKDGARQYTAAKSPKPTSKSTPGKRGKISHASSNLKRKAEEEPEYEEDEFPVQKKLACSKMHLAPGPKPETLQESIIDISSSASSQAEANISQTSSSDAAKPNK
ncbi:hypothetical protein RhiJN_11935 [Ceratobasidium sp. AG-Ba]|nr:hypothetical protein RhiJN_11935 [Ceratobasidium sp. AG-Ba]